jgi:hypothetical protein
MELGSNNIFVSEQLYRIILSNISCDLYISK